MLESLLYPKPPEQKLLTGGVAEPWHCTNCNELIYNLDENGYPAPGAPMPRWWSNRNNQVCRTCYEAEVAVIKVE